MNTTPTTPAALAAAALNCPNWTGLTLAELIDAGRIARTDRAAVASFIRAANGPATLETLRAYDAAADLITTATP